MHKAKKSSTGRSVGDRPVLFFTTLPNIAVIEGITAFGAELSRSSRQGPSFFSFMEYVCLVNDQSAADGAIQILML